MKLSKCEIYQLNLWFKKKDEFIDLNKLDNVMAVTCNYRGVRVFTGDKYVVIVFDYFGTSIISNHINIVCMKQIS